MEMCTCPATLAENTVHYGVTSRDMLIDEPIDGRSLETLTRSHAVVRASPGGCP